MKELTIEQKAQRYDEALKRARELYNNEECRVGMTPVDLEIIFPELKESEDKDERIRKTLLNYFKRRDSYRDEDETWEDFISFKDIIAWLEKKRTSYTKKDVDDAYLKGITDTKNEVEKQYEASYQIRKDIATFIFNYRGDIKDRAKWIDYLGIKVSFVEMQNEQKSIDKVEPKFHEGDWVVVSTTKGDRVVQIASVEYFKDGYPSYITTEGRWFGNETKARLLTDKDVEIVTIPESKVVVSKIKYWSEEDENMNRSIIDILTKQGFQTQVNWLKSLRPQKQWKPSKEQMEALWNVYEGGEKQSALASLYNDLKKL